MKAKHKEWLDELKTGLLYMGTAEAAEIWCICERAARKRLEVLRLVTGTKPPKRICPHQDWLNALPNEFTSNTAAATWRILRTSALHRLLVLRKKKLVKVLLCKKMTPHSGSLPAIYGKVQP